MAAMFIGIGLVAGVLSGLFGIGGGVLIVPALMYVAGMPIKTATGTSLGTLLLPVGLLGAWAYYQAGNLDWRASLTVGSETAAVGRGTVVFVPAGVPHRFHHVTEPLRVLVVFSPPEGTGRR